MPVCPISGPTIHVGPLHGTVVTLMMLGAIRFNQFPSLSYRFFSWSNPIPIMGYIHLYPIIIFPYYVIYINIPCIMFYIPHDVPIHRMSQARMWNAPSSNMSSAVSRCPVVLAQWCPVVGMDGYPNPVTESDIWMVYIYIYVCETYFNGY